MKSRSYKKNKNKNKSKSKSNKKKIGGAVEGFPDLFSSTGQLNLNTIPEENKNDNTKFYFAGAAGVVILAGVLIAIKK
jgi:hypothetical protein